MSNQQISLNCVNFLSLPNEILLKIFKLAENDKNLSQTCRRFCDLIPRENLLLSLDFNILLNPSINLDEFLKSSSEISFVIDKTFYFDAHLEQLEYFLHFYGHKITKLSVKREVQEFFSKILPLMPNLQELYYFADHYSCYETLKKFENFSIPLKILDIDLKNHIEYFKIFQVNELRIKFKSFDENLKIIKFLKGQKNLDKLIIKGTDFCRKISEFPKGLKGIKLKSFKLTNFDAKEEKWLKIILENQKYLREMSVSKISNETFVYICKNLKYLKEFEFEKTFDFKTENFKLLENFTNLKSLKIFDTLNGDDFKVFTKLKMKNLEILEIKILNFSNESIEEFSSNFGNLKSLKIEFDSTINFEMLSKIFENFNNLEILTLEIEEIDETQENFFYSQTYKNENLKVLKFLNNDFKNLRKFNEKIVSDFPNIEEIDLNGKFERTDDLKFLLTALPKLKKIKNPGISKEFLTTLLEHGGKLEEFLIDINKLENVNEVIKNCSFDIENLDNLKKITREKKTKINLSFEIYSQWQRIKTTMDSCRTLKNIEIHNLSQNEDNDVKFLKLIGKNVENLELSRRTNISDFLLKKILDVLPNVENVELNCNEYFTISENAINIKNTRIKSFTVRVEFYGGLNGPHVMKTFFNNIKFPENCLEFFKFIVYIKKERTRKSFILSLAEEFLKNQNLNNLKFYLDCDYDYTIEMTKKAENVIDNDEIFNIEEENSNIDDSMSIDSDESELSSDWQWN
ncbi:hypothetical protein PVAND_017346 [Polypedilum vanderplanki]|uniref:F-box domain-containing protein n=1 Tax=Polypedilum vanderplanki TaxID=319348 RepID=A0A9J6BIS7_POLVA|nr:hypothetical protein PVAND_017346 [Polypedilum vanderplanki]